MMNMKLLEVVTPPSIFHVYTPTLYLTPTGTSPHSLMEKLSNTASLDVRKIIFSDVRSIGKIKIGFTEDYVGTHSSQSSTEISV